MSIEQHLTALTLAIRQNTEVLQRYLALREQDGGTAPAPAVSAAPATEYLKEATSRVDPEISAAPEERPVSTADAFKASASGQSKDPKRPRPSMIAPRTEAETLPPQRPSQPMPQPAEPERVDPPRLQPTVAGPRPAAPEGVDFNVAGLTNLDDNPREKQTAELIRALHGKPVSKDQAAKVLSIYVGAGMPGAEERQVELKAMCQTLPLYGSDGETVSGWSQVHESQAGEVIYRLGQRLDVYPAASDEIF